MPDRPRLVYYTSGLWPCGVASYQRNVVSALASIAEVETVRLPTDRVFGDGLRAVLRQRAKYRHLAVQSDGATAAIIDYTDTFWNGSRLGENFFPAFTHALRAPAIVILHESPGRTDPADTSGRLPTRAIKRLIHLALTTWDTGSLRYEPYVRTRLFDFAAHIVTHADTLGGPRVRVLPTPAYSLPEPTWTLSEVDQRFGLGGKRVALLLGFPQPSKGFDRAVAALPHLPPDVVLLQVGHSERSANEGERLAALAAGRLVRAGYLSDSEMAAVLCRADVGLAPFRAVHQSSSLGHLVGAGLPVVASRIPSTERLATDGAGVRFANCDDPVSLAATVMDVLKYPAELRARNAAYTGSHGFGAVARLLIELTTGACP